MGPSAEYQQSGLAPDGAVPAAIFPARFGRCRSSGAGIGAG